MNLSARTARFRTHLFTPSIVTRRTTAAAMSTSPPPPASPNDYGIETTDIPTAPGVTLTPNQKLLTASILDLFSGRPTLKKLSLWAEDATFDDPLTKSKGRKQYSAQWFGLKAAFSELERLDVSVTEGGNPIVMDLKMRYKVKGVGSEKVIGSVVRIHTDAGAERILGVEDRWGGSIPEGAVASAFRNLNAVTVPVFVTVPKTDEQDSQKK